MKKILLVIIITISSLTSFTQPPPPNPNGDNGNHYGWDNGKGNPHGGAPIGEGVIFLISFSFIYGAFKLFKLKEQKNLLKKKF